jgi:hypothetical protein
MRLVVPMVIVIALTVGISFSAGAQPVQCLAQPDQTFGGVTTSRVGNGVLFRTHGLAVDADGAPNSYRVDGKGLSFTCDGVVGIVNGNRVTKKTDPRNWNRICNEKWGQAQQTGDYSSVAIFGFETDENGRPLVQKQGDPLPGEAYITTTSVSVPGVPEGAQRQYVDAVQIPYVVLPDAFRRHYGVGPADLAVVYWPSKKKFAFAAYGDGGDLGEASVRLHQDLGNDPIVTTSDGVQHAKKGIGNAVITVVFPSVRTRRTLDANAWRTSIQQLGRTTLKAWGGEARLRACAQLNAFANHLG